MLNNGTFLFAVACTCLRCQLPATADDGQQLKNLATHRLTSGRATPEDAAVDLIRACIRRDFRLFNTTRQVRMCEGKKDPINYYHAFLKHTAFNKKGKKFTIDTAPNPLKQIAKVFTARSLAPPNKDARSTWTLQLSLNSIKDQMFVDLAVADTKGEEYLARIIVNQDLGGNWHAQPQLNAISWYEGQLASYSLSTDEYSPNKRPNKPPEPTELPARYQYEWHASDDKTRSHSTVMID